MSLLRNLGRISSILLIAFFAYGLVIALFVGFNSESLINYGITVLQYYVGTSIGLLVGLFLAKLSFKRQ